MQVKTVNSLLDNNGPPSPAASKNHNRLLVVCCIVTFGIGVGLGLHARSFYPTMNSVQNEVVCQKSFASEHTHMMQSRENLSVSDTLWQNDVKTITSTTTRPMTNQTHTSVNQKWCPNARCLDSDLCHPCQRRFLIILASARSASTTLTYMLDSLPGVRMSGENNDELKAIRRMITNIAENKNFLKSTDEKTAWGHNRVPDGAFSCVAQHMVLTFNPPKTDSRGRLVEDDSNTIVGFKTIRLFEKLEGSKQVEAVLKWVRESFPCAKFVINIRSNVEEQAESWEKTFGSKPDIQAMRERNNVFHKATEILGEQAFFLDSSDWLNDISHFNRLIEWLGFNRDCFFDELLEFNTKGSGYKAGRTEAHHNSACRYKWS